jgi:guanylate kinase
MTAPRRGLLFVLSSPSGAGKTTITRRLLDSDSALAMSVSVTTRKPRAGEVDGRDYRFIDKATFDRMVERAELIEHARVFEHWYGTPRAPVDEALASGRDMVFDIDWQGARQIGKALPDDIVRVFVLPPSMTELHDRLRRRAQDSEKVVVARMAKAIDEVKHYNEYDYVIVNDDLERAVRDVQSILHTERLKRRRQRWLKPFVAKLLGEN